MGRLFPGLFVLLLTVLVTSTYTVSLARFENSIALRAHSIACLVLGPVSAALIWPAIRYYQHVDSLRDDYLIGAGIVAVTGLPVTLTILFFGLRRSVMMATLADLEPLERLPFRRALARNVIVVGIVAIAAFILSA